jgi:hypothetical protein
MTGGSEATKNTIYIIDFGLVKCYNYMILTADVSNVFIILSKTHPLISIFIWINLFYFSDLRSQIVENQYFLSIYESIDY